MSNYSDEELEIALYGLKRLMMFLGSVAVVALIGFLMKNIQGVFLFLLLFIPLRVFAGGLHLPTIWMCAIASSALIILVAYILNNAERLWIYESTYNIIILVCALVIIALAPVETSTKPLFRGEKIRYKIISTIITILEMGIFFISNGNDYIKMVVFLVITVEAFYLIVQKGLNCMNGRMQCIE
ncbi:MAG: hypothetical protein E7304_04325 [Butyrivibrio sp.]|jgi:accessory gene regulator B|uniref:accessory gene regulator B family protein n=1 Tax=Butyrivibrio sp. TaxID=28121 RepID=UPI001EB3EB92|nr:accessory gene regulator B family protein [Butyrivibrio sp.]MBE5840618.1 hypothetical protein [Butyrivibrio sp.]